MPEKSSQCPTGVGPGILGGAGREPPPRRVGLFLVGLSRREHGEQVARHSGLGQAISYRFKWDDKGWRVFVTTDMASVPVVTDQTRGAIGVDPNADHLAVSETDGSGNWVRSWRAPLGTNGKKPHQTEAIIGDAVASVVSYARDVGKPIVLEKLDFRQ